jgi:hypothetical protein
VIKLYFFTFAIAADNGGGMGWGWEGMSRIYKVHQFFKDEQNK